MSEKSNPTRTEPLESQSNGSESSPAEEYKVGPGRPPPDKRWKKGGPSPNPHGRPRKEQSMVPDVRKAFEQALNKKVLVSRGNKKVLMTRVEIGLEQLLNQFAKGDRHARRDLMEYRRQAGHRFFGQTPASRSRRRSPLTIKPSSIPMSPAEAVPERWRRRRPYWRRRNSSMMMPRRPKQRLRPRPRR